MKTNYFKVINRETREEQIFNSEELDRFFYAFYDEQTKKVKYIKQIKDYFIQCCAYAVAHNQMFGTGISDIVILITVDGKDPQCFETSAVPFLSDLKLRINEYDKMFPPF